MTSTHVPLMLLPKRLTSLLSRPFRHFSQKLAKIFHSLQFDLQESDIGLSANEYIGHSLVNSIFIFFVFWSVFTVLFLVQQTGSALLSIAYSGIIFIIIFYTLLRYPAILAGKKAELIDKHLIFALKDLLLQVSSGVSLYNALVNIAKGGYGQASKEFEKVARAVNTGTPIEKALEKMAIESKSEFLRRTTWQLINTLKAGASVKGALSTIIESLTMDQRDRIRNYARELNLWSLLYLLFAVVIPSLGATMLVILASFAGFGVTKGIFVIFIGFSFAIQLILIGFVKTRRPMVSL
jgi:archaeal flagellar protein FlaJ